MKFKRIDAWAPLVARILVAAIFLLSGIAKMVDWRGAAHHMSMHHVPYVAVLLAIATFIEVVGGLMLLVGFRARWASLVMFLYLVPVTVVMHGFWALPATEQVPQMAHFMKNLAIMGGLLEMFAFGPGAISLDQRIRGTRRTMPVLRAEGLPA